MTDVAQPSLGLLPPEPPKTTLDVIERPSIVTFGYSRVRKAGRLREFCEKHGIDHVVDCRLKRYSGSFEDFNGYHTGESFDLIPGTSYQWVPDLGNLDYKEGGIRIARMDAIEDAVLPYLARGMVVGLMCACWKWSTCHRVVVAKEIARRTGVKVTHL